MNKKLESVANWYRGLKSWEKASVTVATLTAVGGGVAHVGRQTLESLAHPQVVTSGMGGTGVEINVAGANFSAPSETPQPTQTEILVVATNTFTPEATATFTPTWTPRIRVVTPTPFRSETPRPTETPKGRDLSSLFAELGVEVDIAGLRPESVLLSAKDVAASVSVAGSTPVLPEEVMPRIDRLEDGRLVWRGKWVGEIGRGVRPGVVFDRTEGVYRDQDGRYLLEPWQTLPNPPAC